MHRGDDNNKAEYRAMLKAMETAKAMKATPASLSRGLGAHCLPVAGAFPH